MKKTALWFYLLTKRQLKNIILLAFLFAMPVTAFIITRIPPSDDSGRPRIGIVFDATDETAAKTVDFLVNDDPSIEFYVSPDEKSLVMDIDKGIAECGYILPGDLTKRLNTRSYRGSITLIRKSSDFLPSVTNEIVFSALFRVYGKDIASGWIKKSPIFSDFRTGALQMLDEKYDYYLDGAATFHIDFKTLSSEGTTKPLDAETKAPVFPLRGILAVLIYVSGLFGCIQWLRDSEKGVFLAMSRYFRLSGRILYVFIPAMLFGISGLATISLSGLWIGFPNECITMLLYVCLITTFGALFSCLIRKSSYMASLMPVFILGSLVLCPVFIDLNAFFPMTGILNKLFLPYYYLSWIY